MHRTDVTHVALAGAWGALRVLSAERAGIVRTCDLATRQPHGTLVIGPRQALAFGHLDEKPTVVAATFQALRFWAIPSP
ncbi:hypothetical protein ABGB17_15185 [Sphaerisporangium sp. B11E5]|uniref:hypothetical protein n=1 Tax=Sphaerisporangium sp. B11E5 TaxID=3153563 RepID=UPI00325EBF89